MPQNSSERHHFTENLNSIQRERLNELASLSADICNASSAFINFSFHQEHGIAGLYGIEEQSAIQICSNVHSIGNDLFKEPNPKVIDHSDQIRFSETQIQNNSTIWHLSVPLTTDDGTVLGKIYLLDNEPKSISSKQFKILIKLSNQVLFLAELLLKDHKLTRNGSALENKIHTLEVIQDINKVGTWELDIESGQTIWSEMVYLIHEVPLDFDHNKTSALAFYQENYRATILEGIEKAIRNNSHFDVICEIKSAKGNLKWVRSTGKRVGTKLIGSFQDITELKQRELKFEGIFNSTLTFIGFLNRDGILVEANDTAISVGGLERSDVIGKYFWDCHWWQISEKTNELLKANFFKALSGQTVVYEVEINIANSKTTTILFSMRPVFDDKGSLIYIIPEGMPIDDLVKTRDRFKAVLEGTNAGTWEWDIEKGITKYNEKWAEFLGYRLEELEPISDQTWVRLAHPDDLAESSRKLQSCFGRSEEFFETESRLKHKNGDWIWILSRGKVTEWSGDGKPLMMYGTHQNITSRKAKELELNYQKQLLDALYELSPIGISLNDYETGQFIDVNNTLLKPTGYTKQEFLDLTYWQVTPTEYQPLEMQVIKEMENTQRFENFQKEYIRKDGSRYPVSLKGVVVKDLHGKKLIWSFIRDISTEKEADRKLKDAISSLQAILDASQQVAIVATDINGIITLFNSGAERMLGYHASELVGLKTPVTIHLDEEVEAVGRELSELYHQQISGFDTLIYEAKKGRPVTREWTYIKKNGDRIPVLLSVNAVMRGDELNGFLGVATDIAILKKVEKEITSLLEITNHQNSRLKNFAHIVSHNLRSHAGGITGILKIIQMEFPEIAENHLVELLTKGAENLEQTVVDLTQVVKVNLTHNIKSNINLHKIVQKNLDTLSLDSNESEMIIYNLLDEDLTVPGVTAYVDSIILNLITNAIKYKSDERKAYLKIYTKASETKVSIYFEDNGQGIDMNKHGDKLFGMYKTFHKHHDARGVGLFITKNQIESMGGSIEVISEVNVGTTFIVHLPC